MEVIKLLKDGSTESVFSLSSVDKSLMSQIIDTYEKGPAEHYVIVKFIRQDRLMSALKLSGDFKLKVKVGSSVSFYLWLNVRDVHAFAETPDEQQRMGRYQKLSLAGHLHCDQQEFKHFLIFGDAEGCPVREPAMATQQKQTEPKHDWIKEFRAKVRTYIRYDEFFSAPHQKYEEGEEDLATEI